MTGLDLVVTELEAWAADTGRTLPMCAAEIARIEASGRYVDLVTGEIVNPRVYLQTYIEIAGDNAGAAARHLAEAVNDGRLDLVSINLLRDELRHVAGDWRIVRAECSADGLPGDSKLPDVDSVAVWQHRQAGERYIVGLNQAGDVLAAVGPVYYADIAEMLETGDWTGDPELAADIQAHADEYRQLDAAELVAQGLVQP